MDQTKKSGGLLSTNSTSKERRYMELRRRLGVLRYRRDRLTNELNAINAALYTLNQQIKSNQGFKQLSL